MDIYVHSWQVVSDTQYSSAHYSSSKDVNGCTLLFKSE